VKNILKVHKLGSKPSKSLNAFGGTALLFNRKAVANYSKKMVEM